MSMPPATLQKLIITRIFFGLYSELLYTQPSFAFCPLFGSGIVYDSWHTFLAISIVSPAAPLFLGRVETHSQRLYG
jgi:hypothetical protein